MSSTQKPSKGILRKSATDEKASQIALKHASIIQDRKDLETIIFNSIDRLTDFPLHRDPPYSSANPEPSDIASFKSLVRLFQPTDYDDLIEERNTCGLCGYSLCANPPRQYQGGAWKLMNFGQKNFGIVDRKELQKWCSSECARRALYIKVQLNETAAWERAGIPDIEIDLLEEEQAEYTSEGQLANDLGKLKLEEERRVAKDAAALAMERGDSTDVQKYDAFDIDVIEREVVAVPSEPHLPHTGSESSQLVVEGYKVKFGKGQALGSEAIRNQDSGI